jgi:hypothetical protein
LSLAACGDDDSSSDRSASPTTSGASIENPTVCSLLTIDEIEEVTGIQDAAPDSRDNTDIGFECYWGDPQLPQDSVDVVIVRATSPLVESVDAEPIDSLGEFAQYYAEPIPMLEIYDPPWYIVVSPLSLQMAMTGNTREASIELAELILERLEHPS